MATIAHGHPDHPLARGGGARAQVVVIDGPDMGRAATIGGDGVTVGTEAGCALVLSDPRVSRRHLSIASAEHGYLVRDLGSRNGTLFEGASVSAVTVAAGATLRIGHTFLRIQPEPCGVELPPSQRRSLGDLVGEGLAMRELFAILERAAESEVAVLLEGETGTGKEVAARAIHELSARRRGPLVALDCGALPESLCESELFGHVRGAFTGAMQARKGAFVRAGGGTLFLDELDSLPLALQPRLLRALEARTVRPVGGDEEIAVDVRVIAASQRDLATAVAAGAFRPDLYYRLSVLRVVLPPLRERREDLPRTVAHLLGLRAFEFGEIGGANLDRLRGHAWPGNVRELRNVLDRAIALSPGARSFAELRLALPGDPIARGPLEVRADLPFAAAKAALVDAFEARYLGELFARCQGNISAAAREAGLDRGHLRTLLRKHGLLAGGDE